MITTLNFPGVEDIETREIEFPVVSEGDNLVIAVLGYPGDRFSAAGFSTTEALPVPGIDKHLTVLVRPQCAADCRVHVVTRFTGGK